MKKVFAILMALAMLLSAAAAEEAAENPEEAAARYDYDELVVGTIMPMYGAFTMDNWGNSGSDMDVRKLIMGYNLVEWNPANSGFRLDPSVVTVGSVVTEDEAGNHIYNLTLYDDMVYSDGTPITAKDYAFSWLLRTSPLIDEIGGKSLHTDYISGWKEYAEGKTPCLAGLRVIGKYQLAGLRRGGDPSAGGSADYGRAPAADPDQRGIPALLLRSGPAGLLSAADS